MRTDGSHHDGRHAGVDHTGAGSHRVRRAARGRADDQTCPNTERTGPVRAAGIQRGRGRSERPEYRADKTGQSCRNTERTGPVRAAALETAKLLACEEKRERYPGSFELDFGEEMV